MHIAYISQETHVGFDITSIFYSAWVIKLNAYNTIKLYFAVIFIAHETLSQHMCTYILLLSYLAVYMLHFLHTLQMAQLQMK